jgi:hypothetical protein
LVVITPSGSYNVQNQSLQAYFLHDGNSGEMCDLLAL